MPSQALANAELKSLIIILLLKVGTSPEEIRTAMRLATASLILEEGQSPKREPASAESEDRSVNCQFGVKKGRASTPKQIVRNEYLAPIKSYEH
jgi:hypothetical protein